MLGTRRLPGSPFILAGVAAAALVTGAGVTLAVTSGSPTSAAARLPASGQIAATPVPSGPARPVWPGARRRAFRHGLPDGFRFAGPSGAVHGAFVVPKPGGGYQSIAMQRGAVTAVGATSVTIKSGDGFVKTYQVTGSTYVDARQNGISSVKTGHQVVVTASVNGSTMTAVRIFDLSLLPVFHGGPAGPGWHTMPPGAGSPDTSPPATGGAG
jgi:hypothetical protein